LPSPVPRRDCDTRQKHPPYLSTAQTPTGTKSWHIDMCIEVRIWFSVGLDHVGPSRGVYGCMIERRSIMSAHACSMERRGSISVEWS
jgi:hypothetical protein